MPEVLEITTLSLVDGLTSEDFVTANEDINAYLLRQLGFRWRRIVESADPSGITGEMGDSPVHATIDHAHVDWQLATVVQLFEGEP